MEEIHDKVVSISDKYNPVITIDYDYTSYVSKEKEEQRVKVPSGCSMYYQASDGEAVFLEGFNTNMLVTSACKNGLLPQTISATVLECNEHVQDYQTRRRIRRTAHLPIGCSFAFVELDMRGIVDRETYKAELPKIRSRQAARQKQASRRQEERKKMADVPLSQTLRFMELGLVPQVTPPPEITESAFPTLGSSTPSPALPQAAQAVESAWRQGPSFAAQAQAAPATTPAATRPLSLAAESDFPALGSTAAPPSRSTTVYVAVPRPQRVQVLDENGDPMDQAVTPPPMSESFDLVIREDHRRRQPRKQQKRHSAQPQTHQ